ncbi:MAG: hypothetical protein K8T25_15600 [Planctomycetia bacterium]|nr:hypothetical protein [Planctomycetia bacterium]
MTELTRHTRRLPEERPPIDEQFWPVNMLLLVLGASTTCLLAVYAEFNPTQLLAEGWMWLVGIWFAVVAVIWIAWRLGDAAARRLQLSAVLALLLVELALVHVGPQVVFIKPPPNQNVSRTTAPDDADEAQPALPPVINAPEAPPKQFEFEKNVAVEAPPEAALAPVPTPQPEPLSAPPRPPAADTLAMAPQPQIQPLPNERPRKEETVPRQADNESQLSRQLAAARAVSDAPAAPQVTRNPAADAPALAAEATTTTFARPADGPERRLASRAAASAKLLEPAGPADVGSASPLGRRPEIAAPALIAPDAVAMKSDPNDRRQLTQPTTNSAPIAVDVAPSNGGQIAALPEPIRSSERRQSAGPLAAPRSIATQIADVRPMPQTLPLRDPGPAPDRAGGLQYLARVEQPAAVRATGPVPLAQSTLLKFEPIAAAGQPGTPAPAEAIASPTATVRTGPAGTATGRFAPAHAPAALTNANSSDEIATGPSRIANNTSIGRAVAGGPEKLSGSGPVDDSTLPPNVGAERLPVVGRAPQGLGPASVAVDSPSGGAASGAPAASSGTAGGAVGPEAANTVANATRGSGGSGTVGTGLGKPNFTGNGLSGEAAAGSGVNPTRVAGGGVRPGSGLSATDALAAGSPASSYGDGTSNDVVHGARGPFAASSRADGLVLPSDPASMGTSSLVGPTAGEPGGSRIGGGGSGVGAGGIAGRIGTGAAAAGFARPTVPGGHGTGLAGDDAATGAGGNGAGSGIGTGTGRSGIGRAGSAGSGDQLASAGGDDRPHREFGVARASGLGVDSIATTPGGTGNGSGGGNGDPNGTGSPAGNGTNGNGTAGGNGTGIGQPGPVESSGGIIGGIGRGGGIGTSTVMVPGQSGVGGLGEAVERRAGNISRQAQPLGEVVALSTDERYIRREVGGPRATASATVLDARGSFIKRVEGSGTNRGRAAQSQQLDLRIARALEYLERQQRADGSWSLHPGERDKSRPQDNGEIHSDTAATGLSLLAFLGARHHHLEAAGPHNATIQNGIDYLIQHQKPNGELFVESDANSNYGARTYSHAIATLALCEAYGMTGDPRVRKPAQKAIDWALANQHKTLGGWRYLPQNTCDTSVTGWMFAALDAGSRAQLDVPRKAFTGVDNWLELATAANSHNALYVYNPQAVDDEKPVNGVRNVRTHQRLASPVNTAVGLYVRLTRGWNPQDPRILAGADYLLEHLPAHTPEARNTYYWYYATQVLYHVQGSRWERWQRRLSDELTNTQVLEGPMAGSWDPLGDVADKWGSTAGRTYVTAMNLLSLEAGSRIADSPTPLSAP